MSTTVISQGYIAVLTHPPGKDTFEEISEKLYAAKSPLEINYEGTLLISDSYRNKKYREREFNGDLFIVGNLKNSEAEIAQLIQEAALHGVHIDPTTIQPYTCVWYNGSDSPVTMLTKEDFLAGRTGPG